MTRIDGRMVLTRFAGGRIHVDAARAARFALVVARPSVHDDDPRVIILSGLHAVEGDSVTTVGARWEARLRRDSTDRGALFGLATLARLTYHYPTAERGFYGGLARGLPVAEALRAAKLEAIRRGAPPGEWAAFTAVGDPLVIVPLRAPSRVRSWWVAVLAALALGAGTVRTYSLRERTK